MIQLGLLGYPLDHSLSPKIHQAALNACGLRGEYSLFPIPPDNLQGVKDLLGLIRSGEIKGLNVTIPHKQTVIPLLDRLTETAESIGAVNTIYMDKGNLTGDNTDAGGFIADLSRRFDLDKVRHQESCNALVLGAGGSARAVIYALLNDGWKISITARRPEQAKALISHFPDHNARLSFCTYDSKSLESLVASLDLIVNATPVGMWPDADASPWPSGLPFPKEAFIYDLIYNPFETKFCLDARSAGLPAVTGIGMLVEQAALSFELWTGKDVPRNNLWRKI